MSTSEKSTTDLLEDEYLRRNVINMILTADAEWVKWIYYFIRSIQGDKEVQA